MTIYCSPSWVTRVVPLISGQPSGTNGVSLGRDGEVEDAVEDEKFDEGEGVTDTTDELNDGSGVKLGMLTDKLEYGVTDGAEELYDCTGLPLGDAYEKELEDVTLAGIAGNGGIEVIFPLS